MPWSVDSTQRWPAHSAFTCPPGGNVCRLRHPLELAEHQFISSSDNNNNNNNRNAALSADHRWNGEWLENATKIRTFLPDIGTHLPGMTLPRTAWVRLNPLLPLRLVSAAQKNRPLTMLSFTVPPIELLYGVHGLMVVDDKTVEWLLDTCPEVQCGRAVDYKNWFKRWRRMIWNYRNARNHTNVHFGVARACRLLCNYIRKNIKLADSTKNSDVLIKGQRFCNNLHSCIPTYQMPPTFPDQLLSLIGLASPEKSNALLLGIRLFLTIFLIILIDAFHNLYGHQFEVSYRLTV